MRPSLEQALRQLRLSGLLSSLEVRLAEAAGNRLDHGEFLELILQDELAVRASRLVERRIRAAMFRELKNLDEFDFAFNPSIKRKQIHDLATCRFIREKADVLLLGPPGVGKSFLAQAIGHQAIKSGFMVLYRSIFDLARDFLEEQSPSQQDKMLSRYLKPDLLTIDDMGMKQLPRRSGEYLLEIIMRRHDPLQQADHRAGRPSASQRTAVGRLAALGRGPSSETAQPGLPVGRQPSRHGMSDNPQQPERTMPVASVSLDPTQELLRMRAIDPPPRPGLLAALDRFEILAVLGIGGMGVVLLARDPGPDIRVAIKLLKPELATDERARHRFLVEAQHMQRLAHPHILQVMEVSSRPSGPYFVLPYMEQGSLARLVTPGQGLDHARILELACEVADALNHAHVKGITHRDLKPANVLLDAEGHARLADFGLGRTVYNDSIIDVRRDQTEGTPAYMAPEIAAGNAGDTRCDIYSFGAMSARPTGWRRRSRAGRTCPTRRYPCSGCARRGSSASMSGAPLRTSCPAAYFWAGPFMLPWSCSFAHAWRA